MPMMLKGHEPDTREHREADCHPETGCLYRGTGGVAEIVLRPMTRLHRQPKHPDCTGESLSACTEAQTGGAPVSGVSIWREGLRRSGKPPGDFGCAFVPAILGLQRRGWSSYVPGEEEADTALKPSLLEELEAADRPGLVVERRRIQTGDALPGQLSDALYQGMDAVVGMPVSEDYEWLRVPEGKAVVCGPEMFPSNGVPHAQRFLGFASVDGRRVGVLQNSWDSDWGGALVNGVWLPGCALVSIAALAQVYDCHVIEVVR